MIFYPDSKVKAFQLRLNTPSSSTTSNNRWLHHLKASKVVDHMHDRQFYIYNYNHSSVTVPHARVWVRVCVWVFVLCLSLWVCVHVWKVCLCFLRQENVKSQSNIRAKKKVRMTYKKQYWNIEMQQSTKGHYASTKIANIYMYIYIYW